MSGGKGKKMKEKGARKEEEEHKAAGTRGRGREVGGGGVYRGSESSNSTSDHPAMVL